MLSWQRHAWVVSAGVYWLSVASCLAGVPLPFQWPFGDETDLTRFVTRPDIKAPLFDIVTYDEDRLAPGYWFVGVYGTLFQAGTHPNIYTPCQTGPHMFDQQGELVWSGACVFKNRVACDVRSFEANSTSFLSAIMMPGGDDSNGHGVIIDDSYNVIRQLPVAPGLTKFNMHELTFVDQGTKALYIINRPLFVDMSMLPNDIDSGWITDQGVHELDLASGEITFQWWASDHINLSESSGILEDHGNRGTGWDWLHFNSISKNSQGDYLISARNTNAIYKVCGQNGSILWRLGGTRSTFELVDFNFSRQHDAQFLPLSDLSALSDGTEQVSFLDNGGDNFGYSTSNTSSALSVALDHTSKPPSARISQRIWRPDGGVSQLRGNLQILPNGNRFIGWSENAYISEHAPDGELLMEASFASERSVTYRAYKFPFEGFPSERPVLSATAYRIGEDVEMTLWYVSWNGATNVETWRFWSLRDEAGPIMVGEVARTGFETSFQSIGCESMVYAEAVSRTADLLGRTELYEVEQPAASREEKGRLGARPMLEGFCDDETVIGGRGSASHEEIAIGLTSTARAKADATNTKEEL